MKSKLIVQVNAYLAPFGNNPKSGDWLGLTLNDGNPSTTDTQAHETPSLNRSAKGLYINKKQNATDSAKNLASKFKADWGNTGGFGNLKVTYLGNNQIEFELQNELWTFEEPTGQGYNNNKITKVSLVNAPPPTPKTLTLTETDTVDCGNSYIDYNAVITGGTAPYTIRGTALGNVQSVTGTSTIKLRRGIATTVSVIDSTGASIDSKSLTPTIPLLPSYFTVTVTQDGTSPLAVLEENVVLPLRLYPISFSLDDVNYETSGNFPNLDYEQNYTVYIKDQFGCKVEKTFVTPQAVEGIETLPEVFNRYFKVSNAGTLIINEVVDFNEMIKPNYSNTLSCGELVNVPYKFIHEPDPQDLIVQQFKSSYDYHRITLVTPENKIDITPVLQSQNLRLQEKVDAKLFRNSDGGLGIYFRGGNTYIENTDTINGVSDYDAVNLPTWGRVGQQIYVDGIGNVTIKRVSRDSNRGLYLLTGTTYSSLTDDDGKVQANYNGQEYNTYEFGFFAASIPKQAFIYIEAGFNDMVERVFRSELIRPKADEPNKHLFVWSDPENKAGIVHQTGIEHFARLYCSLTFQTNSISDTYDGDNQTFSLEQDVYRVANLKVAVAGHAMENKLHLALGMDGLYINGINYVKSKMESERVEGTNYYIITAELKTGGNDLESNKTELVLREPLTGITNKVGIPETIPSAIAVTSGGLLLNGVGGFVLIGDS